jgi:hypothetical protein
VLTDLRETCELLNAEVAKNNKTNPKLVRDVLDAERELTKSINSHTDNLHSMISYLCKVSFNDLATVSKELGVEDKDLEYLESANL